MQSKPYTHIVVGAGSAGCILASRLVENPSYNVLLIEAGPDYGSPSHASSKIYDARRVPMRGQSEIYDASLDWNVPVELTGDSAPMIVPQGKIVGGGSSINGGCALRSTEADSKEWVELGNKAWNFESVCKVYDSLEDDDLRNTRGCHPIVRASEKETGTIQKAFLSGAVESGFSLVPDFNETGAEGAGPSPICRRGNRRISAAETFIDPIRHRPNFTLLPNTLVDRVSFSGRRAVGVVLDTNEHIAATQEVIISAGAIFSPAILQRSGIGPAGPLSLLGIKSMADLPVGLSASDHPCIPLVAKPREGVYSNEDFSLQCQTRWSSSSLPGYIDHQLICFSYLFAEAPSADAQFDGRSLAGAATGHVAGVGCNLNKPTSLGTVTIKSPKPQDLPRVAPNYLETPADKASARELVRRGYQVLTSPSMQTVLQAPLDLTDAIVQSDTLLDDYIKSHVTSTFHFCGTCRMASRNKGGVVDQNGRVYGIDSLRVCDASIIPTVPAANTMWTIMMFAERIGASMRDKKDIDGSFERSRL
jgi:choline dehydrogenase